MRRKVIDIDTDELIEDVEIDHRFGEAEYCYGLSNLEEAEDFRNIWTVLFFRVDKPDISEVYSPPRIAEEAAKVGLRQGFALDLTVVGKHGEP